MRNITVASPAPSANAPTPVPFFFAFLPVKLWSRT